MIGSPVEGLLPVSSPEAHFLIIHAWFPYTSITTSASCKQIHSYTSLVVKELSAVIDCNIENLLLFFYCRVLWIYKRLQFFFQVWSKARWSVTKGTNVFIKQLPTRYDCPSRSKNNLQSHERKLCKKTQLLFYKCGEKYEIKREMWELQFQRITVAPTEMVWGMDTKQATALTCIKVDKSIRHLVYDSLLVLNIKPCPSPACSVLSSSVFVL